MIFFFLSSLSFANLCQTVFFFDIFLPDDTNLSKESFGGKKGNIKIDKKVDIFKLRCSLVKNN